VQAYNASNSNFESPAGPSSAQAHHLIGNLPPSSIGGAAGGSKNAMAGSGHGAVDVGGRFSINSQKQ